MRYTEEELISKLQDYVNQNGYPKSLKQFNPQNNLPTVSAYERKFGGTLANWLERCGYFLSDEEKHIIETRGRKSLRSKEECIKIIYNMQKSFNRPLMYDDFRNPDKNSIGITDIKRYWGTMNDMKSELGLEVIQESMMDKQITKEVFDRQINDICIYLKSKSRDFITTREINTLDFCSRYLTLDIACKKFYNEKLIDKLEKLHIHLGKQGQGLNYDFADGEHTTSQYEYLFSTYLRELGLKYNVDYFRDVKYSTFIADYNDNMNCDYVINYNSKEIYIEIAGIINEYKKWYYQNKIIDKSHHKEEYRLKLQKKENLMQLNNLEYYLLFPCDLTKKNLNDILNTDNYLATRIRIENFYKNNLDWNKISQSKELKFDYTKLGRDKQPMAIY